MSKIIFKDNENYVEPKVSEVINQNGGGVLKFWKGTQEQQNEIEGSIDSDTIYFIEDAT